MTRKRVLIDVDGVLAEFTYAFTKEAMRFGLTGGAWLTAEQKSWRFDFPVDKVWRSIDYSMNWWTTLPPLIGEKEIALLNEAIAKHDIFFVTNRQNLKVGASASKQTRFWLEGIGVKADGYYHPPVLTVGDKAAAASYLKLEVGIDDKPENLKALADTGMTAVARRWAYNQEWEPSVPDLGAFLREYVLDG